MFAINIVGLSLFLALCCVVLGNFGKSMLQIIENENKILQKKEETTKDIRDNLHHQSVKEKQEM